MTNREFFNAIALDTEIANELRDFAREAIAKLDARNAQRSSKPSKAQLENEPIKAEILEKLADGGKVASELAELLEISTQKASALCRQLAEEGKVVASEIKVPKKGKVKQYALAE